MEQQLQFATWKARCSSLGHILTSLPEPIKPEQRLRLASLLREKRTGINENGNKTKWTETKQAEVDKLFKVKRNTDALPEGCITHLEDIFRSQFWGRKRLVYNKYLEKGTIVEEDSLDLLSKVDGVPYWKNDQQFENEYIQGMPDCLALKGKEIKSNFDLDTFDKADVTPIYKAQCKGYSWLREVTEWELCYCLVNTPYHRLKAEEKSLFYAMGQPEENEPRWIEAVCQLERNSIFDMAAFKKEYPNADLMHGRTFEIGNVTRTIPWNHDIPPQFRVKRFDITLTETDIEHIKRRVTMCREWLCAKELETLKLLQQ